MSIQHFIRCDVLLPNGHRCESRSEMRGAFDLPRGWRSVTQFERPTADSPASPFGAAFAPVMGIAKSTLLDDLAGEDDRAKREAKADQLIDGMSAAFLEHAPNVAHQGHICDKHEMPKLELVVHSSGCHGY